MSKVKTTKAGNPIGGFFAELINRRVLQISGAYIAGAWAAAEIFGFLFEQFLAPGWAYRLLAIILVVGFPVSMVLAWIVQVQEDGHWEIDHSRGDSKTLAIAIAIGLLITAGLSWLILPQREPLPVYTPMPTSLAVLPFVDPGLKPAEKTVADGLYRSLMQGLERSPELTLVRLGYSDRHADQVAFGRNLGVAYLGSGQFRKNKGQTYFEARMLDVYEGEFSWSHSYTWDDSQLTETANTIANGFLQTMALPQLAGTEFTGTDNHEAYLAFLNGKMHAEVLDSDQLYDAIEDFQSAINLDPGYALAYLGLARALYDLIDVGSLPESERSTFKRRARRAVDIAGKLNPDSADVVFLLALGLDNPQLRIQAWEKALELDSDHVLSYYRYGVQLKESGKLKDAEHLLRLAIKFSPQNVQFRKDLATVLTLQDREEEAQNELDSATLLQSHLDTMW